MISSKLHVAIATAIACAIAFALAWQVRANAGQRTEAARQSAAAAASVAALEKQVAAQSQRVTAAEAQVAALLKALQLASATRAAAPTAPALIGTGDALKATMARATRLIDDGKLPEALDEYVKCYRELQAIRPGSGECQSLMGVIQRLGRSYPAAISALTGLRDAAMAQRQAQPDRRELPFEIALLNERLDEGYNTLALYDSLPAGDVGRQSLAMIANKSFIDARRYADAVVGKPFGQMLTLIEAGARQLENQDATRQVAMRESIITGTLTNIEVLTGAGKHDDARLLTEKLLAFDNSDDTRVRLKQHMDRAQAPKP